jgi:hypothetical protein
VAGIALLAENPPRVEVPKFGETLRLFRLGVAQIGETPSQSMAP